MPVVYSTHPLHPAAGARLGGAAELTIASALDAPTLTAEGRGADIVIVRAPLPEAMFERGGRLRAAVRHGAGLDMIPLAAATRAGVLVANVPGANAGAVAEHVFMVTLALLRRFRAVDRDLRAAGWRAGREHALHTHELAGRTFGIVGLGHVGRAVARIAAAGFGLEVVASTRSAGHVPPGVTLCGIDELAARADVVVLCCPLTPETAGLMDRRRIALMKPGALLVNVARGAVVVEDDLVAALRVGRIGGAALDVFVDQPLPPGHALFGFDNVVLTPHMAGITEESMAAMGLGAVEEALRVLRGELPVNLCNPEAVPLYAKRFG